MILALLLCATQSAAPIENQTPNVFGEPVVTVRESDLTPPSRVGRGLRKPSAPVAVVPGRSRR